MRAYNFYIYVVMTVLKNVMENDLNSQSPQAQLLILLVRMKMPYGKYKGRILCDLPISYLEWFQRKGFPKDKLGILLQTLLEIKMNGLEYLLIPLRKNY